MDTLVNARTFLLAARLGSFAATARALSVAPSVVSKRIGQLEHELGVTLFRRTTRELSMTADAGRLLPRLQQLVSGFDELRDTEQSDILQGRLRIDAPGTVTSRVLGPIFCEFLALHPAVEMDLRLIDRLDSPLDHGCDLAIGVRPSTSAQVIDVPLMPYPCAAYAGRGYVQAHGEPAHPRDLAEHSCLVSLLYGRQWHFYGSSGDFAVTVQPRLSVNDAVVLREAVRQDLGIAVLPESLVQRDVAEGRLVHLLTGFRPPPLWLKAMVSNRKSLNPTVDALLAFLRQRLENAGSPWPA